MRYNLYSSESEYFDLVWMRKSKIGFSFFRFSIIDPLVHMGCRNVSRNQIFRGSIVSDYQCDARSDWQFAQREPKCSHINSIEKNSQGNYILAGFNIGAVQKINGTTGSIIWQLDGKRNDIIFLDEYELRYVHHVRFRPLNQIRKPSSMSSQLNTESHHRFEYSTTRSTPWAHQQPHSHLPWLFYSISRTLTGQVLERYILPRPQYWAAFGSVQFFSNVDRFVG